MSVIKYFSALAVLGTLASIGCTATVDNTAAAGDEELKSPIYACKTDSDCVAIPKGGCCPHGYNVAVNKKEVKAYQSSHVCNEQIMCPLFMVDDTRVAECDTSKNHCVMIQPEDIRCGGFTMNPHKCPKGWSCDLSGHVPDIPGNCVEN